MNAWPIKTGQEFLERIVVYVPTLSRDDRDGGHAGARCRLRGGASAAAFQTEPVNSQTAERERDEIATLIDKLQTSSA